MLFIGYNNCSNHTINKRHYLEHLFSSNNDCFVEYYPYSFLGQSSQSCEFSVLLQEDH